MVIGIILMIPGVPGPGLVLVFVALGILAVDFEWAGRLRDRFKETAKKAADKLRHRKEKETPPPEQDTDRTAR